MEAQDEGGDIMSGQYDRRSAAAALARATARSTG